MPITPLDPAHLEEYEAAVKFYIDKDFDTATKAALKFLEKGSDLDFVLHVQAYILLALSNSELHDAESSMMAAMSEYHLQRSEILDSRPFDESELEVFSMLRRHLDGVLVRLVIDFDLLEEDDLKRRVPLQDDVSERQNVDLARGNRGGTVRGNGHAGPVSRTGGGIKHNDGASIKSTRTGKTFAEQLVIPKRGTLSTFSGKFTNAARKMSGGSIKSPGLQRTKSQLSFRNGK